MPVWIIVVYSVGVFLFISTAILLKIFKSRVAHPFAAGTASIVLFNLVVYALLGGASFKIYGDWMPTGLFILFFVLYLVAEFLFFLFLFWSNFWRQPLNDLHRGIQLNPLKGWGGGTFAEFSNGLGALIGVGVYVALRGREGNFWWAAQLAAVVGVMSTVAGVQRMALEGPEPVKANGVYTSGQYIKKLIPPLYGTLVAVLTTMAVIIPIEDNRTGITNAVGGLNSWASIMVYSLWVAVFVIWLLVTLLPLLYIWIKKTVLPTGLDLVPADIWPNHSNLIHWFIWPTFVMVVASLVGVSLFFAIITGGWSVPGNADGLVSLAKWSALITGILVLLTPIITWVFKGYDYDNPFWGVLLVKDIILLAAGIPLFIGQIQIFTGQEISLNTDWGRFYFSALIIAMLAYLIALIMGAFHWTQKNNPVPQQPAPAQQAIPLQPLHPPATASAASTTSTKI